MEADRSILNITRWMNSTIFSGKWTFLRINPTFLNGCKIRMHTKFNRFSFGAVLLLISLSFCFSGFGQKVDSLKRKDSIPAAKVDSIIKATHSPRKAAIRSAIIPGWGQVYNKKYWKVPIVWGALGVTGYIFFNNLYTYQDLKFSYAAKYEASVPPYDSTNYKQIKPQYMPCLL